MNILCSATDLCLLSNANFFCEQEWRQEFSDKMDDSPNEGAKIWLLGGTFKVTPFLGNIAHSRRLEKIKKNFPNTIYILTFCVCDLNGLIESIILFTLWDIKFELNIGCLFYPWSLDIVQLSNLCHRI